ncbi:MAG TPA: hypothetical protein PLJ35_00915 [Anaerolineae bacterium]|nr:hypothetical protein [Anaerolineae bacterium]HOQ97305.1 hypothetical protein [Anaerolineae bacterium]HOQ97364.1 hypothetical protein [Anaerolineae bacterium]HPL27543.1 hypothetical protein [Anaerolineae bacterium]
MKVAVLGPTSIAAVAASAGLNPDDYVDLARQAGAQLAARGYELVVVPDRGVAVYASQAYREAHGPRLTGLFPSGGNGVLDSSAIELDAHRYLCDLAIDGLTWHDQHPRICQLADVMLVIGLSCGTMGELVWTKWMRTPAVVLRPLVSGIPPEVMAEANIHFVQNLAGFFALAPTLC